MPTSPESIFDIKYVTSAAVGALLTILIGWGRGWYRRLRLRMSLEIVEVQPHHNKVAVRLRNDYVLPLTDCCAYVSLKYDQSDIMVPPPGHDAVITPTDPLLSVDVERLCWSAHFPTQNPAKVDIYAGETHGLEIFIYDLQAPWLALLTEKWDKPCRVFLKGGKKYRGELRIVSKEMRAKSWQIEIDLNDEKRLLLLDTDRGS
jgi:hypothetical protein